MILDEISGLQDYKSLLAALSAGGELPPLNLLRAVRLPLVACLAADCGRSILLVTDRQEKAASAMDELEFWSPQGHFLNFAEPAPLFYEDAPWGTSTRADRIAVLNLLARYHLPGATPAEKQPVVVTSAKALMTRTLPRRDFLRSILRVATNISLPQDRLLKQLVDMGYQFAETVVEQGQFARRGGVLDIWAMGEPFPLRLDYFGDEVESIKGFDPATQRTVEKRAECRISPAREFLVNGKPTLADGRAFNEFHIPALHSFASTVLDYLPKDTLIIFDDATRLQTITNDIEEDAVQLRNEGIYTGAIPDDFPVPYLTWSELQDSLGNRTCLDLGYGMEEEVGPLASCFSPNERYAGQLTHFTGALAAHLAEGNRQYVISRQVPRIREVWLGRESGDPQTGDSEPVFIEGSITEGWMQHDAVSGKIYVFSDSEIFGWEKPHSRRQQLQVPDNPESRYADLNTGDWVVHIDYGIGRYIGLVKRALDGIRREFLAIEYEGGDQLFVPIHQADRLSRYIGPDSQRPAASRLGSQEWANTKNRVRGAVAEVAADLLDLYARRQLAQGYPFAKDTAWQLELEGSFPYIETADQVAAIRAVKHDMEQPRPMDRLLCGDVGYGKTEVALRAAFKAVMAGKQVAVLVPTTILAQQHYDTFSQRLLPFPATVEMLSRFRSAREQDEIIRKLGMGQVDIIIGTHRLLSQDVTFKDLGLVIIDEEQRFGVTHKEALKKLRTEVDVLTLTATPIPRTLYMALTGVRDISTINTPPEERLPVSTHIGPYSPHLVRQAILRELERGGQVFFLHNRVQTIPAMQMHLSKLVPEARYGIGHGQMDEHQLEKVMHAFTHGKIDVLLCTSIIESGLDIPNANTLIVDRADTFGLAQLYQLRGRVGRGSTRAFAYFFRHRNRAATPEGLYTQMLAAAVKLERRLRGLPEESRDHAILVKELSLPVTVELPLAVELPAEYIPEQATRLKLYRRLADIGDPAQLAAVAEELHDRFGEPPAEVLNLLFQLRVKLLAEVAGLAAVTVESNQLVLRYPALPEDMPPRVLELNIPSARAGRNAYWMPFDAADTQWRGKLLAALGSLAGISE